MIELPTCRWRSGQGDGTLLCHSEKFIGPPNRVTPEFCRTCGYVDHTGSLPTRSLEIGGPNEEAIAIATLYTPEIAEYGRHAAQAIHAYAQIHGYKAIIGTETLDPSRPASWSKLLLVERYLMENPACQWIMWIDADAVITKPAQSLEHLLDANADFVVAEDIPPSPINMGVFLARNCPAVLDLMRRAYAKTHYVHHPWWEQPAVADALRESRAELRAKIVPRRLLNSFAAEYQEGDFIIHFAGCARESRLRGVREAALASRTQCQADEQRAGARVTNAPTGKWHTPLRSFFAKLPRFVVPDPTCGVISATDSAYFLGFQMLANSLIGKVKLAVVDLGLTEVDKKWCRDNKIIVQNPELKVGKDHHYWQSWNKPFYIRNSPFEKTLWIDSDCLVVGDLKPLFNALQTEPLVISHPFGEHYPNPNPARLYELLPVPVRLKAHETVNAGVLGFAKKKSHLNLLGRWEYLVSLAAEKSEIRAQISWEDEGALMWAIQAAHMNHIIQFNKRGWNRFYNTPFPTPAEFIRSFRFQPDDTVLHYAFRPKFWDTWSRPVF